MDRVHVSNEVVWFILNKLKPLADRYNLTLQDLDKYVSPEFMVFWIKTYIDEGLSLGSKFATAPWEVAIEQQLSIKAG